MRHARFSTEMCVRMLLLLVLASAALCQTDPRSAGAPRRDGTPGISSANATPRAHVTPGDNRNSEAQLSGARYIAMRNSGEPGMVFDPAARAKAIRQMEAQERRMLRSHTGTAPATWTALGPFTIPNGGLAYGTPSGAVSGRVTAIAIDPTNPSKVYVGTSTGGVWRTTDGGTTWAPIFDNAQSLAIGALAVAPSSPTTLYVGTGEANQINQGQLPGGAQSFFGVGLYRVDNADATATLVGPINPKVTLGGLTYNVFAGRSISKILVHPSDAATVFVSTTAGFAGSSGTSYAAVPPMATLGVWRSTNATADAASVTFQKLVVTTDASVDSPGTGNDAVSDMVMEPGNPNNIVAGVMGQSPAGGIYRTMNALAAVPAFTETYSSVMNLTTHWFTRIALAINKTGSVVTVFAAMGENPTNPKCQNPTPNSGGARMSQDGGVTWSNQLGGYGFCGAQCFYTMAIAANPADVNDVFLGGGKHDSCGGEVMQRAVGGAGLLQDDSGLHVDTHVIAFDGAGNVWIGNDGGVWKRPVSASVGTAYTNLNKAPLNTLQFEGLAVHPSDRDFTLGGTQDNGTQYQLTAGNWRNAETNDGGYVLIDQNATDTTNVTIYHNFSHLRPGDPVGFDRIVNTRCLATQDSWPARGDFGGSADPTLACDGTAFYAKNGLGRSDNSLVYAPMALGPGIPNTLYYGTDRLYRSADRGDTMAVVSQAPIASNQAGGIPVTTIAISPQNDNYRLVGLRNSDVWATSTGSSTLVKIVPGGVFPTNPDNSSNGMIGRAVIDPNNKDVAYVAFGFYAPAGKGVFKLTNLGAAAGSTPMAPVWTAAGAGIPSIPINSFAIDPASSNDLFAGTDIGVYNSMDGGATWSPYGTGLPRVPVFDMAIQPSNRILRVATYGRGVWEIGLPAVPPPSNAPVITSISPTAATAGNGAITLTVNGSNFTSSSQVLWSGAARTTTFVSSTQLTAPIAPADIATAGTYAVTVTTPNAGTSNAINFTVNPANSTPIVPQAGWWWDANLNGSGYYIDYGGSSGSGIGMAAFIYDASGNATWLVSLGGSFNTATSTYTGSWTKAIGGQTLTGAYKAPTGQSNVGSVGVTFSNATHATMTRPDGSKINLVRFPFGPSSPANIVAAQAGSPQSGLWWNDPAFPANNAGSGGTGYGIEFQGNSIWIIAWVYDNAGNPVFYYSTGAMTTPTTYSGTWSTCTGGPQVTSPEGTWSPACTATSTTLSLTFSDATDGVLTMGSVSIPITRFQGF